jgi:uncharacterized membrane protein YhaH (DUF805 family)
MKSVERTVFGSNWIWKDLYVLPEGRLSQWAYFWGLLRLTFLIAIGTNILATFIPAFVNALGFSFSLGTSQSLKMGNMTAFLLSVWPVWSLFRRRLNDIRSDWRARIGNWVIGFTIILIVLVLRIVASAIGIETPIDASMYGQLQKVFFLMLLGLGLVPGGEKVPSSNVAKIDVKKIAIEQPSLSGFAQSYSSRVESRHRSPSVRTVSRATTEIKPKILATPAVQRLQKLPEQGRVKPGWFS